MRLRLRWVGPLVAVAIVAGAATGFAQLGNDFTNPSSPVPGTAPDTQLTMTWHTVRNTYHLTMNAIALDTGVTNQAPPCQDLEFRKPTDQTTPELFDLAATNQTFSSAVFTEYRGSGSKVTKAFMITLTNATIVSIHHVDATTTGAYDEVTLQPNQVTVKWAPSTAAPYTYSCPS